MMIQYFARVPAAAVRHHANGAFAYTTCRMVHANGRTSVRTDGEARLLRLSHIINGEAYLYIGCAGDAVADTRAPFGVTVERTTRRYFRDIEPGATIRTSCGQAYRKRSARTLEMAPGHTHYSPGKWFYARGAEMFDVIETLQG